ncbi:methyl-accepting chemotaxis protein [Hyalangium versicolor]|uniref:methyl-accepting chemotaxis protein n=1 Tax=Hyalangium versicolor TaxID=2861190 RepID=UPI001CCEFA6C|nr:methyl-accepting chemotaxis protein [Hyalangium versicolor]
MVFHQRIATKLLGALCAVIAVALAILVFTVNYRLSAVAEARVTANAKDLATYQAILLKNRLDGAMLPVRTIAQVFASQKAVGATDRRHADMLLRKAVEGNPELLGFWTVWEPNAFDGRDASFVNTPGTDATGRYIPYWHRGAGDLMVEPSVGYQGETLGGESDFYLVPKRTGQEIILNPLHYTVAGTPTLLTAAIAPIMLDGKFLGVVGADLTLEHIHQEVSKIRPFDTGYALLVSNNAEFVSHPSAELLGKPLGDSQIDQVVKSTLANGQLSSGRVYSELLHEDAIEAVVPFQVGNTTTPWALAVILPIDQVLGPARGLSDFISKMGLLTLGVLAISVIILGRRITKPLGQISHVATRIAEGDLTAKLDYQSTDEVGVLADAFRAMQHRLAQVIGEVRTGASTLSSASAQLSTMSQSLSTGTSEQATTAEEVSSNLHQMSASIAQNANSSRRVESLALQGSSDIEACTRAASETLEAMSQIAERISVIDDIAYQTNLLALNAAIEAARAGEHGRGFAVVAAEVRKLAEGSQSSAKQIVELTTKSVKVAERAGKLLRELVPSIGTTAQLVREVSAVSNEQSSGVGQINHAMRSLNLATQRNASAAEELSSMAEEMASQSESLLQLMGFFRVAESARVAMVDPVRQPGERLTGTHRR